MFKSFFHFSHRHQQDHECSHYEKKEPSMQQTTKHVQQILGRGTNLVRPLLLNHKHSLSREVDSHQG